MRKFLLTLLILCMKSNYLYANENRLSGNPLPRFASIKGTSVKTRIGPATTYPVKYIYKSKHQPIEIINEYFNWYQIRDIEGATSWIYKSYIGSNDYTISTIDGVNLYAKPRTSAEVLAKVNKGVILTNEYCDTFCEVKIPFNDGVLEGYIEKSYLWGMK